MLQDEAPHLGMVGAEHVRDLFGLGRLRKGGEAPQIEEDDANLASVRSKRIRGATGEDGVRQLW